MLFASCNCFWHFFFWDRQWSAFLHFNTSSRVASVLSICIICQINGGNNFSDYRYTDLLKSLAFGSSCTEEQSMREHFEFETEVSSDEVKYLAHMSIFINDKCSNKTLRETHLPSPWVDVNLTKSTRGEGGGGDMAPRTLQKLRRIGKWRKLWKLRTLGKPWTVV